MILRFAVLYVLGFVVYTLVRVTWSSEDLRRLWLWIPIIGSSIKSANAYRWISALRLEFSAGICCRARWGRLAGFRLSSGASHFAEEGEQEMRQGVELSKLVARLETVAARLDRFYRDGRNFRRVRDGV